VNDHRPSQGQGHLRSLSQANRVDSRRQSARRLGSTQ